MNKFLFLVLIFSLGWSSCTTPPQYAVEPNISFNRFSVDTINQLSGLVTIYINFTDGDADLGVSSADTSINMYIVDTRKKDTLLYRIPQIPSNGSSFGIAGEIEVDVSQVCCIVPGVPTVCSPIPDTYDETTYKILIRDNAGNWSNEVETAPLKIKCFQ